MCRTDPTSRSLVRIVQVLDPDGLRPRRKQSLHGGDVLFLALPQPMAHSRGNRPRRVAHRTECGSCSTRNWTSSSSRRPSPFRDTASLRGPLPPGETTPGPSTALRPARPAHLPFPRRQGEPAGFPSSAATRTDSGHCSTKNVTLSKSPLEAASRTGSLLVRGDLTRSESSQGSTSTNASKNSTSRRGGTRCRGGLALAIQHAERAIPATPQ